MPAPSERLGTVIAVLNRLALVARHYLVISRSSLTSLSLLVTISILADYFYQLCNRHKAEKQGRRRVGGL
jgi:hypothetical protein